jgi:hypothetical protein
MTYTEGRFQFRAMQTADIAAGLRLCRAARWNQVARDWAGLLQFSPAQRRLASRDSRVVGTVTAVSYQQRLGWVGVVLVDQRTARQSFSDDSYVSQQMLYTVWTHRRIAAAIY